MTPSLRDRFRHLPLKSSSGLILLFIGMLFAAIACSGGGGGGRGTSTGKGGLDSANFDCNGGCANLSLSASDVTRILQQGVAGANALGVKATFAVVDRVGNVLAAYQMTGAPALVAIDGRMGASGGLEGVSAPSVIAAISKAGTGAYLSSQGNAFSTRTASQIVQEHFNPGEDFQPGGPLFGVQFSQLICGDVTVLNPSFTGGVPFGSRTTSSGSIGPRPLPLGLSADPGGFPLYIQGDLVGGIGVELDGIYTFDRNITDYENNLEELVALSASIGFESPSERTANNMIVGGRTLRFSDVGFEDVPSLPAELPELVPGELVSVAFYTNGSIRSGAVFGTPASGYAATVRAGVPAAILVNDAGAPRFPSRSGASLPGGEQLQPNEVEALLDSALLTANRSRAAIRRPLDSSVRVSIFVVDHLGTPLGFVRSQDAPVFGTDVSLQKARTAVFFSSVDAATTLSAVRARNGVGRFEDYSALSQAFVQPTTFSDGVAYTARAIATLARPFYPDGFTPNPNGPLSLPFPGTSSFDRSWSPFNDGLQLDLVFQRVAQALGIPANPPPSIPSSCTDENLGNRLRNGIQIFAGSVPLYRNGVLIGGLGISGDGIDQDDMVSFIGASRKGLDFAGHTDIGGELGFNAPFEIRADLVVPRIFGETRLRYINCPEAPFIDNNDQNKCDGL